MFARSKERKINIPGCEDFEVDIQMDRSSRAVAYRSGFQGHCVGIEIILGINIMHEL